MALKSWSSTRLLPQRGQTIGSCQARRKRTFPVIVSMGTATCVPFSPENGETCAWQPSVALPNKSKQMAAKTRFRLNSNVEKNCIILNIFEKSEKKYLNIEKHPYLCFKRSSDKHASKVWVSEPCVQIFRGVHLVTKGVFWVIKGYEKCIKGCFLCIDRPSRTM